MDYPAGSFIQKRFYDILIDNFADFYYCFVTIIEEMQSRLLERDKYTSNHQKVLINPNPLNNSVLHKQLEKLSFTDFLYLPSKETKKMQEQIIENYQSSYQKLEREYDILCSRLSAQVEGIFYNENPEIAKFVLDIINQQDTFLRLGLENGFFKKFETSESDSE